MPEDLKECCRVAIEDLKQIGELPFCPTCGAPLMEDHDPQTSPFEYQCQCCCQAGEYRVLPVSDPMKSFCPNCGKRHGGEIRWPKGFMVCCGGGFGPT